MDSNQSWATRLYRGEKSYPIVARRRWWYTGSAVVMLIGIISIAVFGLNPSIDFKGGAVFQGPLNGHSLSDVVSAVESTGIKPELQQTTGAGKAERFRIETKTLTTLGGQSQADKIENALDSKLGISPNSLSVQTIGSTWGGQITRKAIEGLIAFLIAVTAYMTVRFEWKMALAAIIALIHDLVITAGIYALSGLQVSPSTVIALLTILGYSLYDTVVVFDKVRENTAGITGGSRMTFSQAANLAVNQTLVRSINTSVIALLPVAGLLVIGVGVLGAGSLQDLSFALLIGLASGAYSSIFIATPLVCEFKEREPAYQQLARRVAARRTKESAGSAAVPATVGAPLATTTTDTRSDSTTTAPPDAAQTTESSQPAQPAQPAAAARPPRPGQPSRGSSRNARRGRPSGRSKSRKRR